LVLHGKNAILELKKTPTGPSHFRLWSRSEDARKDNLIKGLHGPKGSSVTFTDHTWLIDNSIAIATMDDIIFIMKDGVIGLVCCSWQSIILSL
jgi:hypothetical protein